MKYSLLSLLLVSCMANAQTYEKLLKVTQEFDKAAEAKPGSDSCLVVYAKNIDWVCPRGTSSCIKTITEYLETCKEDEKVAREKRKDEFFANARRERQRDTDSENARRAIENIGKRPADIILSCTADDSRLYPQTLEVQVWNTNPCATSIHGYTICSISVAQIYGYTDRGTFTIDRTSGKMTNLRSIGSTDGTKTDSYSCQKASAATNKF